MSCEKYPFDYNKHIVIKQILTPFYKSYTEYIDLFQGISLNRCEKCMKMGYESLSVPFQFDDIGTEEVDCTLKRMGLKKIQYTDIEIMDEVQEIEGEYYCLECLENIEQKMIDAIEQEVIEEQMYKLVEKNIPDTNELKDID